MEVANMTNEELFNSIKQMIVDQLGVDEETITEDSSFVDDLNADSLDMVELVMAMEQEFDIEIPDDVAEKVVTVKDAVEYVQNLTEG
jgi:acyl carrier protein